MNKMTGTERIVRIEWEQEHGEPIPKGVISEADRAEWKKQESEE